MWDVSMAACWGILRPFPSTAVPLRGRLNERPVIAGLPIPTDDLIPVAGGPS